MSHVTPTEFEALEVLARERARMLAVLAPRAPRPLSITERLQGPATARRPSALGVICTYAVGLACAALAGFYLPAPLAHFVSLALA